MSPASTKRLLGVLAFALAAPTAACVGGAGPVEQLPYVDPHSGDREAPTGAQDPTALSNEPEGSSLDRPGVVTGGSGAPGSGAAGPGASAVQCSGTLSCVTAANGKTQTTTVTLSTKDGQCVATSEGGDVVLAADGSVIEDGKSSGKWQASGTGFVFTSGTIVITCTRQ